MFLIAATMLFPVPSYFEQNSSLMDLLLDEEVSVRAPPGTDPPRGVPRGLGPQARSLLLIRSFLHIRFLAHSSVLTPPLAPLVPLLAPLTPHPPQFEASKANFKKNFWDVYTMEEWWDWMEGPLVKGVYPRKWYNGVDFNANETGYISHFLQLVGGVQVGIRFIVFIILSVLGSEQFTLEITT